MINEDVKSLIECYLYGVRLSGEGLLRSIDSLEASPNPENNANTPFWGQKVKCDTCDSRHGIRYFLDEATGMFVCQCKECDSGPSSKTDNMYVKEVSKDWNG